MTLDDRLRAEMLAFLPRLRRFAHGLTGSKHDGDDLLQATCERAISSIDQFQPGTRLDSWMFRIARNLYLNELRATAAHTKVTSEGLVEQGGSALDGRHVMEMRSSFEAARQCVTCLPEDQRTILLLVTVEGLSYEEVAGALEVPMGTVASRVARARLSL